MLISEKLIEAGENVLSCENECEVDSLALLCNESGLKSVSFIESEEYLDTISDNIKVVITNESMKEKMLQTGFGVCVVSNPRLSFFRLHNYLATQEGYAPEAFPSTYGEDCKISDTAKISTNNVRIGNRVSIEDNVVIYPNVVIGDDVVLRAGCVIGGEGFECKKDGAKVFVVKHVGSVRIGNGSEVHCNTCIDKALYPWDVTQIGEYCVIDGLVHIGHGVKVGNKTLIASSTVVGGRTQVGNDVWIGIGCTIRNGIQIGDCARVTMGAVVIKDVEANTEVFGNPARRYK